MNLQERIKIETVRLVEVVKDVVKEYGFFHVSMLDCYVGERLFPHLSLIDHRIIHGVPLHEIVRHVPRTIDLNYEKLYITYRVDDWHEKIKRANNTTIYGDVERARESFSQSYLIQTWVISKAARDVGSTRRISKELRKELLLEALKSGENLGEALKSAKLTHTTYTRWCERDPVWHQQVLDVLPQSGKVHARRSVHKKRDLLLKESFKLSTLIQQTEEQLKMLTAEHYKLLQALKEVL